MQTNKNNPTNPTNKSHRKPMFISFAMTIIDQLDNNGQHRLWQHYRVALHRFLNFCQDTDLPLSQLTATLIESYEVHLKHNGVCRNTSSFYMRILRAIYNRAVEQGHLPQKHPFCHVYTGIDHTSKRAISLDAVRRLKQLDLHKWPARDMAKDAFLMSFYLRGISFIDMAHLTKDNLRDGYLCYNRSKTRQQMLVKWEPEMQQIVDKYQHITGDSPYLLPFLLVGRTSKGPTSSHRIYHNAEVRIAYHLKKIGQMLGLPGSLTLYVARHTWATAARDMHQPISVISEALGHDSEATTQIYLASIQTAEVDLLNAQLISLL